ncbi:hypothetical protein AQ802_20765 [Burkholderia pseudomallei]|uniref:Uncharacterized protein n=1 Tax=Burkholderia pseudomallei (strain 1710b) TaxID=320372 RepID=Q3JGZ9_BURP1|nr:hypothetical protein BURPS1710b_A2003 [Burkholderia pseudomallei 1710b]ALB96070.1 hypothetical protein AM256_20550 [Burkholderia pseudomallei]EDO90608.1 conserved hypothetical protein [Burkholderia pseudomallei Pasteur 52237]KEO70457.1 hypothetical protein J103_05950 [Burkholderia pseudomallei MSHR5855]ALC02128.1 hypothetical protein AM257_20575 [Burkholderia pseudomallei]
MTNRAGFGGGRSVGAASRRPASDRAPRRTVSRDAPVRFSAGAFRRARPAVSAPRNQAPREATPPLRAPRSRRMAMPALRARFRAPAA